MSENAAAPEPVAGPATPVASPSASAARTPRGGVLLGWLAIAFAATIAPLAYAANLGFAPFTAVAGLLCIPLVAQPRAPAPGVWILVALVAWALVSYAWSPLAPVPADFSRMKTLGQITGVKLVLELALFTGFALAMRSVPPDASRRALMVAAVLLTAAAVVMVLEGLWGARFYSLIKTAIHDPTRQDLAARNVKRGCYVLALLIWPLLVSLVDAGRRPVAVVLAVASLIAPVVLNADSPIVALALGAGVFAAVWRWGREAAWFCIVGVVVYFVLAPIGVALASQLGLMHLTPGGVAKLSWSARLQIWGFVDRLILVRPFTGWGLDASRAWPGLIPLHPHDAALQLWLELGPVGAALAALFFAWLFDRIAVLAARDPLMGGAAAASATSYLVIGGLSFGVWQEWWLALGAVAVAVCLWATASRSGRARRQARDELVPL